MGCSDELQWRFSLSSAKLSARDSANTTKKKPKAEGCGDYWHVIIARRLSTRGAFPSPFATHHTFNPCTQVSLSEPGSKVKFGRRPLDGGGQGAVQRRWDGAPVDRLEQPGRHAAPGDDPATAGLRTEGSSKGAFVVGFSAAGALEPYKRWGFCRRLCEGGGERQPGWWGASFGSSCNVEAAGFVFQPGGGRT